MAFPGATVEEDLATNTTRLDLDALEDISSKKDQILDNTLETRNKDRPVRGTKLLFIVGFVPESILAFPSRC